MHAYVLHSRPYKETSALLDVFTEQGRQRVVLRGARRSKGHKVQLFSLYAIEWAGRSELKTLTQFDNLEFTPPLIGERLFCGFYLNELLTRLLPEHDAYPVLFELYQVALFALREQQPIEPILRQFEWQLIVQLGYGYSLTEDSDQQPLQAEQYYQLQPDVGFCASYPHQQHYLGADILCLSEADWEKQHTLRVAKRLMRQTLTFHLKGQPIISREFFTRPL